MIKNSLLFFFVFLSLVTLTSKVNAGITDLNDPKNVHLDNEGNGTINNVPAGVVFNNDGTKMFTTGSSATDDEINEWSLSTAFDVSTAEWVDRLPVGINELGIDLVWGEEPFGLTFNDDGTKLFLMEAKDDDLHEITLDTAYDLSTYDDSTVVVWDVSSLDLRACGITFNNDGTKIFIAGFIGHTIIEVPLSTPYSIASGSIGTAEEYSVSANDRKPRDIDFNSDGTKMYIISGGDSDVSEYTLNTAFDLSEGFTHKGEYDVSSEDTQPFAVEFNNDGTKMFMLGYANSDSVHEYSLTTAFEINNTAPTLSSSSPSDGASSVGVNDNIVLTFSEAVDAESGNILIKKSSDESTVEEISVTSSNVSGSGSTEITINPDTTLEGETSYYITIESTAFDDVDSASYAGISDSTTLNFTTETTTSDPFEDRTVVALVEAQTEAPKRVVQYVTTPVYNRLNWLRGKAKNSDLSSQKIKFQISNPILASLKEAVPISTDPKDQKANKSNDWSFWSEGTVSIGKIGDTTSSLPKDINTSGITFGMDIQLNKDILHGYTFSYTNDDVDVGSSGTSLDIDSYSISKYATFHQSENKFVEGNVGISKLDLKHIRKSGSNILHGDRDGQQIYGSINYIASIKSNNFTISPNVKVNISHTVLEDYSETGTNALNYKKQNIQTGALYTGINFKSLIEKNNISFRPNFGMEVGLDFSPTSDAEITYVSDPNTKYTRSIDQQDASGSITGKTKIGFDILSQTGLSLITLYERNQSENSHSDTFYFGVAYNPSRKEVKYAMAFNDNKASLEYIKNLKGLNIKFDTNYNMFSEVPDYELNLIISSKF